MAKFFRNSRGLARKFFEGGLNADYQVDQENVGF